MWHLILCCDLIFLNSSSHGKDITIKISRYTILLFDKNITDCSTCQILYSQIVIIPAKMSQCTCTCTLKCSTCTGSIVVERYWIFKPVYRHLLIYTVSDSYTVQWVL